MLLVSFRCTLLYGIVEMFIFCKLVLVDDLRRSGQVVCPPPCAPIGVKPEGGVEGSAAPMAAFPMATVCWNSVIQLVAGLRACPVEYTLHYQLVCRLGIPCIPRCGRSTLDDSVPTVERGCRRSTAFVEHTESDL